MPKTRGGLARTTAPAFAAVLCLASGFAPASAQEAYALRGTLGESQVEELRTTPPVISGEHTGSISYQPVSPGALPEDVAPSVAGDSFRQEDGIAAAASGIWPEETANTAETTDDPPPPPARLAGSLVAEDESLVRRMNERAEPAGDRSRQAKEDPYAPLGLRVGTFRVVPVLEQGLEWTSNANEVPDGESALLSATTLRLTAVSDWSRHTATFNAYGTYRKTVSGAEVSDFEGGVKAGLQLDLAEGLRGLASLAYTIAPEAASSPALDVNVVERPLRQTIDGTVALAKDVGKLRLGIAGDVSRDQYGDAELAGGGTLSQSDRDSTLYALRLRSGYAISPAITPFVEGEVGRRIYDETHDANGYARSATRIGARAGVALDLREKLTGEASLGWISEDPDDARLATISGLSVDANLAWSPVRGTVVRLNGTTAVETTTTPGETGSLLYRGELSVEREIRSNLSSELLFGAEWRDYTAGGNDLVLFGEAGLTWWLNRNLGVTGRLRHERLDSSLPGRDYDVSSVFLGMKLQR